MKNISDKVYLLANWKMYLDHAESVRLARECAKGFGDLSDRLKMAIFPSALAFEAVTRELIGTPLMVGAQNVHWLDKGGYTGEISAEMYARLTAQYALVGHSERRHLAAETNHQVRQKLEALLQTKIIPVLCVGETASERESGEATEVVEAQLRAAFDCLAWPEDRPVLIAYEPVWAIGTGMACEPDEAERMQAIICNFTRALLIVPEIRVVYGGSVRADNVQEYLNQKHIDGVLVGGASVKYESWSEIVNQIVPLF